jgi:hypothetical protein
MAAQVEEVERAECSVDSDQVDIGRAGEHDDGAGYVGAVESYPDISSAQVAGVVVCMRGDEVLPAAVAILQANGIEAGGIVEAGHGEFVAVHGDAVESGDDAAGVFIVYEIVGQRQHGAIKGEIGAERRVLAYCVHVVRHPVVALLRAGCNGRDGQGEDEESVTEAARKHRLMSDQTLFRGKSLYQIEIFFSEAGWKSRISVGLGRWFR